MVSCYGTVFSILAIDKDINHDDVSDSSDTGNLSDDTTNNDMPDEQIDQLRDDVVEAINVGAIDIDEEMAAIASSSRGVSSDHLAKLWRISVEEAKDNLKVTTQNKVHSKDPKLAKNYGTNDRMLRYKHIKEYFFMDTFLATKKGDVSSHDNTCYQLFLSYKNYLFSILMRA